MKNDNEMIELGSVSTETHGHSLVGPEETATGERYFMGGISAED